jgi:hypothetical protein
MRHGPLELLDFLSVYAELCCHPEPDTAHDPLGCPATVRLIDEAASRRIDAKAERLAAEHWALPRLPHSSRIPAGKELPQRSLTEKRSDV